MFKRCSASPAVAGVGLAAAILLGAAAVPSRADVVGATFTGTVLDFSPAGCGGSCLPDGVHVGDAVTGAFWYNTLRLSPASGSATGQSYGSTSPNFAFATMTVDGLTFQSARDNNPRGGISIGQSGESWF